MCCEREAAAPPTPKKDELGSPPAGKRNRSPTKPGQSPSEGRGAPSPKPNLDNIAKMNLKCTRNSSKLKLYS